MGRNGFDNFLLSLPGIGMGGGGNGGRVSSVLAAATSALHDLARLRDFGRIEVRFGILCSALSLDFSAGVAGVAGVATR